MPEQLATIKDCALVSPTPLSPTLPPSLPLSLSPTPSFSLCEYESKAMAIHAHATQAWYNWYNTVHTPQ